MPIKVVKFVYESDGSVRKSEEFFNSVGDMLEDLRHKCCDFHIELDRDRYDHYKLVASMDFNRVRYILGDYTDYALLLHAHEVEPWVAGSEVEFPKTLRSSRARLEMCACLDYTFQLQRRWRRQYLYARKWFPGEKKRETVYIGPWNAELQNLARKLGVKV